MSEEQYFNISDYVEKKLDEADYIAEKSDARLSHTEVFNELRNRINTFNKQNKRLLSSKEKLIQQIRRKSMHSHAIGEVAASLAMDGMPLTESEKDELEIFHNMTKEEQEKNIQELVAKYKTMGKERSQ